MALNLKQSIIARGNINRIEEMLDAKCNGDTIAAVFKQHGMDITPDTLISLPDAIKSISKKAIPKKMVNVIVKVSKELHDEYATDD